jgi:hypothetical protein
MEGAVGARAKDMPRLSLPYSRAEADSYACDV